MYESGKNEPQQPIDVCFYLIDQLHHNYRLSVDHINLSNSYPEFDANDTIRLGRAWRTHSRLTDEEKKPKMREIEVPDKPQCMYRGY